MSKDRPKHRIQAVADRTGVPAPTLRAWERRYGFPRPSRTESAYRLYSDRDVELVIAMRQLTEEGMSASEAARVTRGLLESRQQELKEAEPGDAYEAAAQAMVSAAMDFDPARLEMTLRRAMFMGSASMVYRGVLAPAQRKIGDLWHQGEVSIAQEHMMTHLVSSAARDLLRTVQVPTRPTDVVLACFADEEHELALYGLAFELIAAGHRPLLLGARTPPAAIRHAVEQLGPDMVGLSVSVSPEPHRARTLVEDYGIACQTCSWMVGGGGSADLAPLVARAGGLVTLARDAEAAAADMVRELARVQGLQT